MSIRTSASAFFSAIILVLTYGVQAQNFEHKEQPILAGTSTGTAQWELEERKEQPLASWGFWSDLNKTPNGTVFSITPDNINPGDLIIAGSFDSIGDTAFERIAEYGRYPLSATAFGTGVQNGVVYSTISYRTELFAGGTFTMAGNSTARCIAMWDGTGWHPLGTDSNEGVDSTVLAMALIGDSLYVGGNFTHAGGLLVNHIAIWNLDSNRWEAIVDNGVVGVDGGVAALLVSDDESNILYVGGGFLHAGSTTASKIAYLDSGHW
ncbi:MAG TPA: hypothetical protein VGM92_15745, partial [Candidatus Kapabacteria bacterium]